MREFNITLPATSANIGPAFDAAALALDLALSVSASKSKKFSIVATGRDSEICGQLEDHLILSTYKGVLQSEKKHVLPLSLTIQNEFPIGKAFASSPAPRLPLFPSPTPFGPRP